MIFFASFLIGLSIIGLGFLLFQEEESLIKKRFAKVTKARHTDSIVKKIMTNLIEVMKPLSTKNLSNTTVVSKTKKMLLQAGYACGQEDVIRFEARKLAYLAIATVIAIFLVVNLWNPYGVNALAGGFITIMIVYRLPDMQLQNRIKFRKKEFMKYIADAVDLLGICVQAGLGIDAAFSKVAEEFKLTSETIANEFDRLNKDILSGLNRQEAYKNLVSRNDDPDLQSFVALLIQTDKLGTSISTSLDAFCDSLRTKKKQRIEELSQQASTKMTIPMVLCMMPAIFIIIMYPALQKIMLNLN